MSHSILAMETCSETCSVALRHHGQDKQLISNEPRGHADNILPMIESLLNSASLQLTDLDAISFTKGPGAFTGVRIGTSVAQGLSVASNVPLIALSSLAVVAQGVYRRTNSESCIATLDARMSEVYLGYYKTNKSGVMQAIQDDQVAAPAEIICDNETQERINDWLVSGPGWTNYLPLMQQRFKDWQLRTEDSVHFPEAIDLISLAEIKFISGQTLDAAEALPTYIRDQVAKKKR